MKTSMHGLMQSRRWAAGLLILGLMWFATDGLAAQEPEMDTRPGVAVFPLENGGSFGPGAEDLEALEVGLQQLLLVELDQSEDLRIVERTILRELLQEQDLAQEGRVDAATAARVGRLVGARYSITGSFMDNFGDFSLTVRIVDSETSEILHSQNVRGNRTELYSLLVESAERIIIGVDLPPLPVEQRQERETREISPEAITMYSRAQVLEDLGNRDAAMELYERIRRDFPQMTEAEEALEQLRGV